MFPSRSNAKSMKNRAAPVEPMRINAPVLGARLSIQSSLIPRRIYFMPWLIVVKAARQTDFSSAGDRARIGLNPVNPLPIWTNHHIVVLA